MVRLPDWKRNFTDKGDSKGLTVRKSNIFNKNLLPLARFNVMLRPFRHHALTDELEESKAIEVSGSVVIECVHSNNRFNFIFQEYLDPFTESPMVIMFLWHCFKAVKEVEIESKQRTHASCVIMKPNNSPIPLFLKASVSLRFQDVHLSSFEKSYVTNQISTFSDHVLFVMSGVSKVLNIRRSLFILVPYEINSTQFKYEDERGLF